MLTDLAQLASANADFLLHLRQQTRDAHEAIEAELDLVGPGLNLEIYRRRVGRFYGFYLPLEARLQHPAHAVTGMPDAALRQKTAWLAADLASLGLDSAALPTCAGGLPDLRTQEARFGCHYVLEGATLGGQVIGRHLRDRLGIAAGTGGRFFASYGDRTGSMWQSFRGALTRFAAQSRAPEAIVAGAVETFDCMRRWCADPKPIQQCRSRSPIHGTV